MDSEQRGKEAGSGTRPQEASHALATGENDYVTRVLDRPDAIAAADWNGLLALAADPSPFVRHEYLCALHDSGCATAVRGWQAQFLTLWRGAELQAACPLYLKSHSWGEYVFDWAWAQAHEQHGLPYYPKALVAVPFTPVPGARLLARDDAARAALVQALLHWVTDQGLSSLHLLFAQPQDLQACTAAGLMLRHTVQFHWHNPGYRDFDHFLAGLQQDKRKKIRQERRKVADAGVRFRALQGREIGPAEWDLFYLCYERTYHEHGNPPYLNRDFFHRVAHDMPEHWLLFVAERAGQALGCSLIALDPDRRVAYGRYWGALERVDCLHFEACYYQPLQWCITHGYQRFEGGAQGEHKMARALLPVRTSSAHWLAHPAFADAVDRFLQREDAGMSAYLADLQRRQPLRRDEDGPTSMPDNAG